MSGELSEIIKPFKVLFIILIVEFLFILIFFTALYSGYDKNLFEIKLNNTLMNCYYSEEYTNGIIINATSFPIIFIYIEKLLKLFEYISINKFMNNNINKNKQIFLYSLLDSNVKLTSSLFFLDLKYATIHDKK